MKPSSIALTERRKTYPYNTVPFLLISVGKGSLLVINHKFPFSLILPQVVRREESEVTRLSALQTRYGTHGRSITIRCTSMETMDNKTHFLLAN